MAKSISRFSHFGIWLALAIIVAMVLPMAAPTPVEANTTTFYSDADDGELGGIDVLNHDYTAIHDMASGDVYDSDIPILIGQIYDEALDTYQIWRGALFFDTSSIPDGAVISSAKLNLRGWGDYSTFDFFITVQDGTPTYPHKPLQDGDYLYSHYSGNGGQLYTSSFLAYGWNTINLNSNGIGWISKTGWTKFVLRSNQDIDSFTPNYPGGYPQYVGIGSADSSYKPQLEVTYSVLVDAPQVTTNDTTDITETAANLHGYLDDDGGEACSVRFKYGTSVSYGSYTSWSYGKTSDTSFDDSVYGLSRGTLYHLAAQASNSNSTVDGSDKTFLTYPAEPYSTTATAGDEEIDLAWSKGDGAEKTKIFFKTGTYPTVYTDGTSPDGTEIYFDTGTSKNHASLSNGVTYYYILISFVDDGALSHYSTNADSAYATPQAQANPTVQTNEATGVGDTTATLNGNLVSLGGYATTDVSFEYYIDGGGVWENTTTPVEYTATGSFANTPTGLTAASLYHFRTKATNDHGTSYGGNKTFTTGGTSAPTIETQDATDETMHTATLHGEVTSYGGSTTTVSFEWGLTTSYGHSSGDVQISGDTFWKNIDGLDDSTTYHFRALGENDVGTGYGDDMTFITSPTGAPTVQTSAVSALGAKSATINGLLVGDGGSVCEVRFQWYEQGGTWGDNVTGWLQGKQSGATFSEPLADLDIGKTYYYRAQARNDDTIISGASMSFTTVFGAPVDFEAKAVASTAIELTWTLAGDQTYIVTKPTGYPADRSDGVLLYFGTDSSKLHSGLTAGTTYYYKAWSWSEDGTFSNATATALATTKAPGPADEEAPDWVGPTPDKPSRWTAAPDSTTLQNLPIYGVVNDVADAFEIPQGTFWFALMILLAIAAGVGVYFGTHSMLLVIITVAIIFGIGWGLSIVPLWIFAIYVVAGGFGTFLVRRM